MYNKASKIEIAKDDLETGETKLWFRGGVLKLDIKKNELEI